MRIQIIYKLRIFVLVVMLMFSIGIITMPISAAPGEVIGDTTTETEYFVVEKTDSGSHLIQPYATINGADLSITKAHTPVYTSSGTVSYIDVTITWQWLKYVANYLEDTIVISWDSTFSQWRAYTSYISRKHYYQALGETSWTLKSTNSSVRDVKEAGFAYDQSLFQYYSQVGTTSIPTYNKGILNFRLTPQTSVGRGYNVNLFVNYYHKVVGFGQGSVTLNSVSVTGSPSISFGFSVVTKYDAAGTTFSLGY